MSQREILALLKEHEKKTLPEYEGICSLELRKLCSFGKSAFYRAVRKLRDRGEIEVKRTTYIKIKDE